MKHSSAKNYGFSLVEIVVALTFLTVLLIPVYLIFDQGTTGTRQVKNEIVAQQYATNLLGYLCIFPYDHKHLTPVVDQNVDSLVLKMDSEALSLDLDKRYSRKLTIREFVSPHWPVKYKVLNVSVSWKEREGRPRKLSVCSLIFK
jgi:type II secretory pathway pseudopilin PulG